MNELKPNLSVQNPDQIQFCWNPTKFPMSSIFPIFSAPFCWDARRIVEKIRRAMPGAGLSADAIVGFPGETEVLRARWDGEELMPCFSIGNLHISW